MKKTLLSTIACAAACAALSAPAFADSTGQINFTGEIVASACGIDSGSLNQTVNLGSVASHAFSGVGTRSTPQSFDINLTNCDTTVSQSAYFTFTGTSHPTVPGLLGTVGDAEGVGIRLQSASGEYLDNGAEQGGPKLLSNGTNTVRFAAMYEAAQGSVKPGRAEGVANFTVRYE